MKHSICTLTKVGTEAKREREHTTMIKTHVFDVLLGKHVCLGGHVRPEFLPPYERRAVSVARHLGRTAVERRRLAMREVAGLESLARLAHRRRRRQLFSGGISADDPRDAPRPRELLRVEDVAFLAL